METLFLENLKEIKKHADKLEKKLNIKISILGKKVTIEGSPIDEYEAEFVLEAIDFGFPASAALLLKEEDILFRTIHIKHFTSRKNMEIVRARLIGTRGKTKQTIENISDCRIIIKGNTVGIIGPAEEIDEITTAFTNLIRGAKQANIYKYLENVKSKRKQERRAAK